MADKDFRARFEDGVQALVHHYVEEATAELQAHCARQVAHLTAEVSRLTAQIRRWPIVGTDDVKTLRHAVHYQVAAWFDQVLPDLALHRLGSSGPGLERHLVARYAAHNALYRAIEDQFQVPELKALPQEEVSAALAFIRRHPVPLAGIWRAVVRKAIHQRVQFWVRRGILADTAGARQGALQTLWNQVRHSGLDPASGEVARRRLLRLIDRAAAPERYRAAR